jgi:C-terminal binding protein
MSGDVRPGGREQSPAITVTAPSWAPIRRSNVLVVDSVRGSYVSVPDIEAQVLQDVADVTVEKVDDGTQLSDALSAADVVIAWHHIALPRNVLRRLGRCRGVVRASVGYDNIDLEAATELGIPVANVPDYGTEEVADHTVALILAMVRRLPDLDRHVRGGGWDWRAAEPTMRLRGARLGVIGLGRIGMAVARRAQTFGITVGFHDPYLPSGIEKALAVERYESLAESLGRSDIVSLHTPLTPETFHLIGRAEFALMRPGVILVNTARGQLVDGAALEEELVAGRLGAACLDVVEGEPVIPAHLLGSSRVLMTPHAAFYSGPALSELRRKAAMTARLFLAGERPRTLINDP